MRPEWLLLALALAVVAYFLLARWSRRRREALGIDAGRSSLQTTPSSARPRCAPSA